jgi:hypothetical protein
VGLLEFEDDGREEVCSMARAAPSSPNPSTRQQQAPGVDTSQGETNALIELVERLSPLESRKYPVSPEIRWLVIVTIVLAACTTWVFPLWSENANVGGWTSWGLGGWISSVTQYGARNWLLEVSLGGLALLLEIYMVWASNWLKEAPEKMQWIMVGGLLLVVHNVAVFAVLLALWALVILLWAVIGSIATAIVFVLVSLLARWAQAR